MQLGSALASQFGGLPKFGPSSFDIQLGDYLTKDGIFLCKNNFGIIFEPRAPKMNINSDGPVTGDKTTAMVNGEFKDTVGACSISYFDKEQRRRARGRTMG